MREGFQYKISKEILFEKCMPYGRKQPEINDAGVSRVGVRMGDFLFKIQPNRNYSAISNREKIIFQ